jgi:glutamine amidotransferase
MKVDILDLGSGNVASIRNVLSLLNIRGKLVSRPGEISAETLIIPGVGSAGPYMKKMRDSGLDNAVKEHAMRGKNLIGICLGFQLLHDFSDEDGGVGGLGLISGHVARLRHNGAECSHNGWEPFRFEKRTLAMYSFQPALRLTRKTLIDGRVFYNHEYGVIGSDSEAVHIPIANCSLSGYSAMVIKKNIAGMQFHPEKSQQTGLALLSMLL